MDRVPSTCKSNELGGASDHCKDSHGVETGLSQGPFPYDCLSKAVINVPCGSSLTDNNMLCQTD